MGKRNGDSLLARPPGENKKASSLSPLPPFPAECKEGVRRLLKEETVELKSIPRDYLLVRTPGYVSWQHQAAQENPQLELFDQDSIDIPVWPSLVGLADSRTRNRYENDLRRYYLAGIDREKVDRLLRKAFELSIPLHGESSADQWVPHGVVYNVEVEPQIWQNRLALFFDGNIESSVASLSKRIETWSIKLKIKTLGERYLEIWRNKWPTAHQVDIKPPVIQETQDEGILIPPADGFSTIKSNLRGRKRRAVLRQLNLGNSLTDETRRHESIVQGDSESSRSSKRGRTRRSKRRKKLTAGEQSTMSDTGKVVTNRGKTISAESKKVGNTDCSVVSTFWQYQSRGIPDREAHNKVPVKMSINFPRSLDHVTKFKDDSQATVQDIRKNVPVIYFAPVDRSEVCTSRQYHLISYYNPHIAKLAAENDSEVQSSEDSPNYPIHIADIIDDANFIGVEREWYRSFVSVVQGDHDFPRTWTSKVQASRSANSNESLYWHRFNILLYGFSVEDSLRELPYSKGYGVFHSKPDVVYRENRWGFYDVDQEVASLSEPSWRPSWKFPLFQKNSSPCNCDWSQVSHDLDACRHLGKDTIGGVTWGPYRHQLPMHVLQDALFFSRRPFEAMLEHQKVLSSMKNTDEVDDHFLFEHKERGATVRLFEHVTHKYASEVPKADKDLNSAICLFLGLGVKKQIRDGFSYLLQSAKAGSLTSRAILPILKQSYGQDLSSAGHDFETWLDEAAEKGSKTAMRSLTRIYDRKWSDVLLKPLLNIQPEIEDGLQYETHVKPYFDLENLESLAKSIDKILQESLRVDQTAETTTTKDMHWYNRKAMSHNAKEDEISARYLFGSLLHMAALFGFLDTVRFLLDLGFDIDGRSSNPALRTPLLCALHHGHHNIAKYLAKRGALLDAPMVFSERRPCNSPSPLHYLVNVSDDDAARDLAKYLVRNNADVNYKCNLEVLHSKILADAVLLTGKSVTPLRWAVINRKPKLVKVLLSLGAKFALHKCVQPPQDAPELLSKSGEGLLLETPCTDTEILEMFFARARVPGLPNEFSQTPLGLLLSEDDGPHRRLRPGFEDFDDIKDALNLLLDLQPGFETEVLWSAVRHDHVEMVKYLIQELEWDFEKRHLGLTMFQTALLYGRLEIANFLLSQGADPLARTEQRHLTCYHLIALVKRDSETDLELFELVHSAGIDINAEEKIHEHTAFHIAVRNQKLGLARALLDQGADMSRPVDDMLDTISQGRSGFLREVPIRPRVFGSLHILGEVLIQTIQDDFYSAGYVADLLVLTLEYLPEFTPERLVIDKENGITILHLLAMLPAPDAPPRPQPEDWQINGGARDFLPSNISAPISLLQLAIQYLPSGMLDIKDEFGDTPLHYACAGHQFHSIRTLIDNGVDPHIRNNAGLQPIEIMAWSVFFLGPKTLVHNRSSRSWHPTYDLGAGVKPNTIKRQTHPMNDLSSAFSLFESIGLSIHDDFKRLVLGWDFGIDKETRSKLYYVREDQKLDRLEIVPTQNAADLDDEPETEINNEGHYVYEWSAKVKRKYVIGKWTGPERRRWWWDKNGGERETDWDDRGLLIKLEKQRNAL